MQSSFTFGEQRTYKYAKQLGNVLPADSQVEGLNSRYFADPHLKLYPTNTKEATQRSIINFFGSRLNSEQPPSPFPSEQVEQRLKTASDFWEAGADFFKAANEVLEVPSFTEKFALEVKIGDGRILSRLPINTPVEIVKSATALFDAGRELSYAQRTKAAMEILRAGARADVAPDAFDSDALSYIQKAAGLMKAEATPELREKIAARFAVYPKKYWTKLAALNSNLEYVDRVELCEVLDGIESGVKAAAALPLPENHLFEAQEIAEPVIELANGQEIKVAAVSGIDSKVFAVFGDGALLQVFDGDVLNTKVACDFLSNLNTEDADLFCKATAK